MNVCIAIDGIGLVGGFGTGVEALLKAMTTGRVPPSNVVVPTADGPIGTPVFLANTSHIEHYLSRQVLRRIDHYAQLALLGAHLALEDAGLMGSPMDRTGILVATGYGPTGMTFSFLDTLFDNGGTCASPTRFSSSVHNAAAAYIAMILGGTGPDHTVSQFDMSVPTALLTACLWLEEGRVDAVLLGGVDEYCGLLGYCWHRFFGADGESFMRPLLFDQQSAIPGEGSVFFLLRRGDEVPARYATINAVDLGTLHGKKAPVPENAALILGADGHRRCSALYPSQLLGHMDATCYTPLYGSLPVGFGFDLAAAALLVREGRIFPPSEPFPIVGPFRFVPDILPLRKLPVCCLKLGSRDAFATAVLS